MLEKNLGTLRSRGPLPRVKRRVQTSGAVVDASPGRRTSREEVSPEATGDLSGPLRLPSENLSATGMARATEAERTR